MDLTPPLTRSPASPSSSYCSSERSSLGHPSPRRVAQHYRLASVYGDLPPCSMPTQMDQETPLPTLDSSGHTEWNHVNVLGVSAASTPIPNILSAEYEAFGNFSPVTLPTQFHHAHQVFHPSHHTQEGAISATRPPLLSQSQRSPIPPPSRPPLSYAPGAHLSHPAAARLKLEVPGSEYGQAVEIAQYPSPRSVHVPGPSSDVVAYGSRTVSGASYLAEAEQQGPPQQPQQQASFYPGQGGQTDGHMHDRSFRVNRPRRAPRRLTTKEEANFQCEVKGCGKLFSRSYNFKAHMETHDENREYPFPCLINECSKKFVRKTDLQRHHQSVHMKERSHRCDYCSRMFARKDTLRRHMDDGCSKRFDLHTLDLRTEGYDGLGTVGSTRSMTSTGSAPHLVSASSLPPLALPPNLPGTGLGSGVPRSRDSIGVSDLGQDHHGWGR